MIHITCDAEKLYCARVKFDGLMPGLWASQPVVA